MAYYDDVETVRRTELGVTMFCHLKKGNYTEIVATGEYTDQASIFDNSAFSGRTLKAELRNALKRHARMVKRVSRND